MSAAALSGGRGAFRRGDRRMPKGDGGMVWVDGLLSASGGGEWGFVIGQRISGEQALWSSPGFVDT